MTHLTPLRVAWDAWWTTRGGPPVIAARQQARLADLVDFARAHSRFYAERYRDLPASIDDVRRLPPVTKPELMSSFDDWVTDPAVTRAAVTAFVADPALIGVDFLGRYVVVTTSGSTGEPALLVLDERVLAVTYGLAAVRGLGIIGLDAWWRVARGRARQAAVFATGGHYLGATMFERRARAFPVRRKLAKLYSASTPLPALVRELNAFQPVLLGGYPSALTLLAGEQAAGRLQLQPALISAAGETLTPAARARIETVFGCGILESYSTSEAPALTLACRFERLHVNADWFILEPIDADGQPVPPGQQSHSVLVTNLANQVQPIIRYELGDRVVIEPDACPCGSPLPAVRVEGRTDDVLTFTSPAGDSIQVLPLAIISAAEETPGVRQAQLIQTGPAELTVRLATTSDADSAGVWAALAERLTDFLAGYGLTSVSLVHVAEPPAPDPRSGKFRQVWVQRPAAAKVPSR